MPNQPPPDASNGSRRFPRPKLAPAADPAPGEHDHGSAQQEIAVAKDDDQTLADSEQTLADSDQTLSDADQTGADNDQTSADSDQVASDRDQAASDRDLASGDANPGAHELSRDIRQRTTRQRAQTAHTRLEAANKRDAIGHARDLAALARDQAADARDLAMLQRDAAYEQDLDTRMVTGEEIIMRAAEGRKRAAQHRAQTAEQRALAAQDRQAATEDREQAARDRLQALADLEALARQLAIAETDPLTGSRGRAAGLIDLDHEVDRCRRTTGLLVVVYVDFVGLKAVNDTMGHGAGDELLKRGVQLIKEHLRSYDLVIRLGGDEFLCVISNMPLLDARQRFSGIAAALAAASYPGAIRTGFAELTPDETPTELIARADGELIESHRGDHDSRPEPVGDTSANPTR